MKLEIPRFDGVDPIGWIFKVNQFFDYYGTPEHERLQIAAFYMEGRALSWFQLMSANAQFTSWPAFIQALQTRFAPSQYEDPIGTLCKLMQKGTVAAYLSEFEDIANRIVGIPPAFLLGCFISGLTPEICRDVQPTSPSPSPKPLASPNSKRKNSSTPAPLHLLPDHAHHPHPSFPPYLSVTPTLYPYPLPCLPPPRINQTQHPPRFLRLSFVPNHLLHLNGSLPRKLHPAVKGGFASVAMRNTIEDTGVPLGYSSCSLKTATPSLPLNPLL